MNGVELATRAIGWFNHFVLGYFLALNTVYLVLLVISLGAVFRFMHRTFFSDYRQILQSDMTWPISILVAAHDEEKTIVETIRSLMMVNYGEFEIIVVNDGSNDNTLCRLVEAFDLTLVDRVYRRSLVTERVRGVYGSLVHPRLIVVDKVKGGKSDALNAGINMARYPLFCSIDADSVIEENALLRVIKPFMEHPRETVAVGGVVRIVNGCEVKDGRVVRIEVPDRVLPTLQVVEYLRAFLFGRVGWSVLQSLLIISGAFGVYKRREVIEIGGYRRDTHTEDLDLVVRLHRYMRERKRKYRVVFVPDPVCWTEAPRSVSVLRRQRARWHRGLIETLWEHRVVLFNPRFGTLGMLAVPHTLLFETLGPFIEILGYVSVLLSWALGILDTEFFLLFFAVAVLYGIFLSVAAVLLEEISFRRYPRWLDVAKLIVFGVVENFGYRQMLSLFKIKVFFDVFRRRRVWGAMDRSGFRPERSERERSASPFSSSMR